MRLACHAVKRYSEFVAERIPSITPRTGRPQLYPWDRWLDGHAWRIKRGEDFDCPVTSMASMIRLRAQYQGGRAHARILGDDTVEFQFFTEVAA